MMLSYQNSPAILVAVAFIGSALVLKTSGFVPLPLPPSSVSTNTQLHISSWGKLDGPTVSTADNTDIRNNLQAYLPEPVAVEARSNIDGTCLVSGLIQRPASEDAPNWSMTDQFLFDLLNHEESAFEFDKICVYGQDSKFAKKRLLSRSARYTGLLDKLDFTEGETDLPQAAQLEGVTSWLAVIEGGDHLASVKEIAATAKAAPSVENVAILLTEANELDAKASQAALEALQGKDSLAYTLVAVGHLEDTPEGGNCYEFQEFGTEDAVLPGKSHFSREEAFRLITELLQLECGKNKALSFGEVYNVNATNVKLIKGLRSAGYWRAAEIDHMITKGPEAYKEAVENWETENPDAAKGYTTDAWWEQEIYQKSRRDSAARDAAKEQVVVDARTQEIEAVAKEWGKREFFRQSMAGELPDPNMTEEAFIESVWDQAMVEGELKYRQSKGEISPEDEEAALADFKTQQERKQQAMLKRAKEELAEILDEDIEGGGDDIRKRMEAEDKDDEEE